MAECPMARAFPLLPPSPLCFALRVMRVMFYTRCGKCQKKKDSLRIQAETSPASPASPAIQVPFIKLSSGPPSQRFSIPENQGGQFLGGPSANVCTASKVLLEGPPHGQFAPRNSASG